MHWLGRWREDTGTLFSLETLASLRRGGRIGAASSFIGGLLGLRPILEVMELHRGAPTGAVGAHAGPGAWGVFYQQVRGDDPLP